MIKTSLNIVLLLLKICIMNSDNLSSYPSSCVGLDDGVYSLKLMDGEYPVITVKCSNEYIILDYNLDNNIKYYFKSWESWFPNIVGPSNTDIINWEEWYLPDGDDSNEASTISYLVSPDCNSCDINNPFNLYSSKSTYWMTGTLFGCFWRVKGAHNCDVDWDSYTCKSCSNGIMAQYEPVELTEDNKPRRRDYESTGICPVNIRSSNKAVETSHYDCVTYNSVTSHLKPSLGTNGEFCVCTKPLLNTFYDVSLESQYIYLIDENTIDENTMDENVNIKLYQSHFSSGTYRITKSGTYTIMEDIIFDFNSGDINDPQAEGSWWPTQDQSDEYPGAGKYKDSYFMGFFAGITIETSDVVLDLNGHTIKMSNAFYSQQRWFVGIELTTQYFLPGQGFGNFGPDPKVATNTIIKGGTIGLSSHHGIHGNNNENIILQDIIVKDFETHGIQFNGFNNIKLINVDIAGTSNKVYFSGEYAHMRALLPRMRAIADESGDKTISFYGRNEEVTMQDIIDKIEYGMNLVFKYVINDFTEPEIGVDCTDSEWNEAKYLFLNRHGLPNGAAQYGIFLNTFGASVFTYNLVTSYFSTNAYLENVKIHDMKHAMREHFAFRAFSTINFYINGLTAPLNSEHLFEDLNDLTNPVYKGSLITDAYIAMEYFSDNWNYLGAQVIGRDVLVKWAIEGDSSGLDLTPNNRACVYCNFDVMIHSGKGINGLRIDGVSGVTIDGLEIYNLHDSTPLGSNICGDYIDGRSQSSNELGSQLGYGGHFRQTQPMQTGFSGNMNQAINLNSGKNIILKNINIYSIISDYGPVFGISVWPSNDVILKGNIKISQLFAGALLNKGTFTYYDFPNRAPSVCAILYYSNYSVITKDKLSNGFYPSTINYNNAIFDISHLSGHVGCFGNTFPTVIGLSQVENSLNKLNKSNNFILVIFIFITFISIIVFLSLNKLSNNNKFSYILLKSNNNKLNYGSIKL